MGKITLEEIQKKYEKRGYDLEVMKTLLEKEIAGFPKKFIVLDDDPTGVQTVHDVTVFTDWSVESMEKGLQLPEKLFFVLTNSRGLTEEETIQVHRKVAENAVEAWKKTGQDFVIISRSDSTLRGHFPLETTVLKDNLEAHTDRKMDGEVLFPFFKEGGRFTAENIHYVNYGGTLVPAGETEFAADKTFGYTRSDLCEYVEEKTKGAFKAENVTSISLEELRGGKTDEIEAKLMQVEDFNKVIVNALDYEDVMVFAVALYRAMAAGKEFLFRTAAALVKVLGGVTDIPLLTAGDMKQKKSTNGGIIVVGSHTKKTTAQLEMLKEIEGLHFIEFDSDKVLEDKLQEEVDRVVALSEEWIEKGETVVTFTKRKLLVVEGDTKEQALKRSVKISQGVQALVGNLSVEPSFVIAKGGITSSDVGVKALGVKEARVLGQIRPGIPVWQTDAKSKFPGIPYIIFPGNVGNDETLKEAVEILLEK